MRRLIRIGGALIAGVVVLAILLSIVAPSKRKPPADFGVGSTTAASTVTMTIPATTTTARVTTTTTTSLSGLTVAQQEAVNAAKQYLQTEAFSRQGLIDQLDSSAGSGFSVGDATAAVDGLNVNWNAEAVQSAKQYLQTEAFSCQGLVQQLSSAAGSQYTVAQAQYAARQVGLC